MMTPAAVSSLHRPEGGGAASPKPPEQELKCPRCDSYNTKFCYYNNYSLSQPRYFCKTCRRYWTKGGALRNVPFGGGSRKNRKSRSTASLSSPSPSFRLSSDLHARNMQELGFFQLGGCTAYSTICGASGGSASGQVVPYGAISSSPFVGASSAPVVILDCPSPAAPFFNEMAFRGESPAVAASSDERMQRSLATSIESLSSINQDLHWKLQQKRLAMLLGGEGHHPATGSAMNLSRHHHSPSLVFSGFKELSTAGARGGGGATACFLDNSTHHTPNAYATGGVEKNSSEAAAVDWMGTWNDVHAFSELQ